MPAASSRRAADAIYHDPRHPYTIALLRSVPRLDQPRRRGSIRSRASRPT
jgi:ABC-type oligopeptide transport system ATPase subunit